MQKRTDLSAFGLKPYRFFERLAATPSIEAAYIYGSRARGDYRWNSDIDLAFVMRSSSKRDWFAITDIIEEADTLLEIDYVRYDAIPAALEESIVRDGKLLFGQIHES